MSRKGMLHKILWVLLFFCVGLFGQGTLVVDVNMDPSYYHENYCCLSPIEELFATYEVNVDFQYISASDSALPACTLRVAIDPGELDSIVMNGLSFENISDLPGFDATRSLDTDFYISVGPLAPGIPNSISFLQTFRDLGPCESFTTRSEIYTPDLTLQNSGVDDVDFFLLPELTAEIEQYPDSSCHRLITDVILSYCPHRRDRPGTVSDSIVMHLNFDPLFWRTDSVYWPTINPGNSWDTTFGGTLQYSFLGRTDTCGTFVDTLRLFTTRLPSSPWCEGQQFVVNMEDFIDCNSFGGHEARQDILYNETWLDMPLAIDHHMQVDRVAPFPLDSITGDSRTVCYEPNRQCLCEGDTIRLSATVEIGEMMCHPYGVNLLLLAWPQPGTIFRDIETEAIYTGETGYFLSAEYRLDSLLSGDIVTFSRDLLIEQVPGGNNQALIFGDSIHAVGPCEGLLANRMSFMPCSLTALSLTKTADEFTYTTGDTAHFTVEVTNEGGRPFNSIWITDSLSNSTYGRFVTATPTPTTWDDSRVEWYFEDMNPEDTYTLNVGMEIFPSDSFPECGRTYGLTNYAYGEAFSGPGDRDLQVADTSIDIEIEVPCFCFFDLDQNSFSPAAGEVVRIRIMTRKREEVHFDVYNVAGQRVCSIGPSIVHGGSEWTYLNWEGRDDDGNLVPSGAYYIVLRGEYNFETGNEYRCGYKPVNVYNK